ncbi:MAG: retropepsin-like aspartic protease [Candidatus Zixiibacteriota bacterium]
MKRLSYTVSAIIVMTALTPLKAVELSELLIQSAGGEAALETLRNLQAWEVHGRAMLNGQQATFVQYFVRPNRQYTELTFPEFSVVQAFDGEVAWQTDLNGRVSELEGYARKEIVENVYLESFEYLFSDSLARIATYIGLEEQGGEVRHKVAFYPLGSDTLYAFFDTLTGLREVVISNADQLQSYTYLDDYRDVSGLMVPHHTWNEVPEALAKMEFWVDTFLINSPVDSSIFSKPEQTVIDFSFPAGVAEVTLPIKYEDGHIRIPVTINGKKKVWMLLDTGSSSNVFNSGAIADLGLPEVGTMSALGLGGAEQVKLVRTDSVQIGELVLYNQIGGSMDLSKAFSSSGGEVFGGVLGQDFWSRFTILVDYARSKITVYSPGSVNPPSGGISVPFYRTMLIPTVGCSVDGVAGDFIVDIGNPSGVLLNKYFVEQNQLEDKLSLSLYARRAFGGVGGMVTGRNAYTSIFRIGDIELRSLLVFLPDTAVGMMASREIAGNIGNRVLEKFRVLFDYENSRLVFYRY